jgi:hypothetical protein
MPALLAERMYARRRSRCPGSTALATSAPLAAFTVAPPIAIMQASAVNVHSPRTRTRPLKRAARTISAQICMPFGR